MLIMALSQFTLITLIAALTGVIAVLIGVLLVCASVLASRVGRTNAALKRIEEALVRSRLAMPAAAAAAAEVTRSPEVSGKSDAARYLTIRDLKITSEPPHSCATPVNADAVAKKERDALFILMSQRRRRRARQGY